MMMNPENLRRYTVGVLVSNEPGVLSRVSGLFSRRGFNIESLAVGPTARLSMLKPRRENRPDTRESTPGSLETSTPTV